MQIRDAYRKARGMYWRGRTWTQNWIEHFRTRPSVLIYTMGKVGSSTMLRSLREAPLPLPVYAVHFLSEEGIDWAEGKYRNQGESPPGHLRTSRRLRRRIEAGENNWRIISLFREPISRMISDLFENARKLWPELVDDEGRMDPERVKARVHDELANFDEATDYVCTWFDEELNRVFDIDLFAEPFDHERGYVIRQEGRARALIIRLEDLSTAFQPALNAFLPGQSEIDMVRANVRADDDRDATIYQSVKHDITVPRDVVERIYSSQYVQHLYSDDMIEDFMRRWCRA